MYKKIEHKPLTLKSLIDYSVLHFADCPSVSFVEGTPITYKQLGQKIEEVAALLSSFGLQKGDKVALFFIDGDGFKGVNDTYGHQAGDLVLIEMARRLSQYLRQHDFMARLGGDEFAVILPNISSVEHVLLVVQNVLNATHEPIYLPNGQSIYFSFSVGVAMSVDAANPQQLIHHADQAMYTAKASPEQRYALYQHSPSIGKKYGY